MEDLISLRRREDAVNGNQSRMLLKNTVRSENLGIEQALGYSTADYESVEDNSKQKTQIAITAFNIGDYENAFLAAQAADKSNAEIQYILGWCYRFGDWLEINDDESIKWYYKAVMQGHTGSLCEIGELYIDKIEGRSDEWSEKDSSQLIECFEKALESCNSRVKMIFAKLYVFCTYGNRSIDGWGELVKVDDAKSLELITVAAYAGYAVAQYELGRRYENGDGVLQDYAKTAEWYRQAAEKSSYYVYSSELARLYKEGIGVEKNYNEAIKWYRKALEYAEIGELVFNLAEIYENVGRYHEAVKLYRKLAEQGNSEAQVHLADCYYNGKGLEQDRREALNLYRCAAKQGNENAIIKLQTIFYDVAQNSEVSNKSKYGIDIGLSNNSGIQQLTQKQKQEIRSIIDVVIFESGIKGVSFGEDDDNPYLFFVFIPCDADERLVTYTCNKLFHRLGLLPQESWLRMDECGDCCNIVSGNNCEGGCHIAVINHPIVLEFKETDPQSRFILKNWRD